MAKRSVSLLEERHAAAAIANVLRLHGLSADWSDEVVLDVGRAAVAAATQFICSACGVARPPSERPTIASRSKVCLECYRERRRYHYRLNPDKQRERSRRQAERNRELGIKARRTGKGRWPEYQIWAGMIQRCHNPNDDVFKNYGARGITVCDEWRNSFDIFLADVGRRPSLVHSLDRVNNDGDYEPGNCVWATHAQQRRNTRRNVYVHIHGVRMCSKDAAKVLGITQQSLNQRARRYGMPLQHAVDHYISASA